MSRRCEAALDASAQVSGFLKLKLMTAPGGAHHAGLSPDGDHRPRLFVVCFDSLLFTKASENSGGEHA
jgi:hypothetical protein